jgi:DnaD/phage-associated family protein
MDGKMGFTQESIQYAMKDIEFSAKSEPFAYLDAILRNLYENGAVSSRKINEFNNAYSRKRENIKEVLGALEYTRKEITPRYEQFYDDWTAAGYPHDIILLACRQTAKNGSRRFESVGGMLKKWKEAGLETEEAINEHLKRQDDIKLLIEQVYDCAGIKKQIGDPDRKLYTNCVYENGMSHDAVMYAAEISSIANEPSSFLRKVLSDWTACGVKTLDDAMKQSMDRYSSDMKGKKAFAQHSYSKEDMEQQKKAAIKEREEMEGLDDYHSGCV